MGCLLYAWYSDLVTAPMEVGSPSAYALFAVSRFPPVLACRQHLCTQAGESGGLSGWRIRATAFSPHGFQRSRRRWQHGARSVDTLSIRLRRSLRILVLSP